jgi:hypothetical protein
MGGAARLNVHVRGGALFRLKQAYDGGDEEKGGVCHGTYGLGDLLLTNQQEEKDGRPRLVVSG